MWNRNVLLLSLIVIGNLNGIRTESECWSNELNTKMCEPIDKEINPCDNFYQFACGKYIEKRKEFTERYASLRNDVQQNNNGDMLNKLKYHLTHTKSWNRILENNLLVDLYVSCMRRDADGLQPMLQLIDTYGGWPVLRDLRGWKKWQGLEKTKGILKNAFDIAPILKVKYNKSAVECSLELPTFAVDIDRLLFNKSENYRNLLTYGAIKFGATPATAYDDMEEVIQFELELVQHYKLPKEIDLITFSEMQSRYPTLVKYIRSFLEPNPANNSDIKFKLESVQYFERLELTLKNTTHKTIANYIIYRAVMAASKYLTRDFYKFVKRFSGIDEVNHDHEYGRSDSNPIPDDEECFDQINQLLPMVLNRVYVDSKFWETKDTRKMKTVANEIVKNIYQEFIEMVQESAWMDNEAKERTIHKLNSILVYIADEFQLKPRNLNKLSFQSVYFLNNVINIMRHRKNYVTKNSPMTPWQVSVAYDPYQNEIYIPYGALQWPLFFLNASSYSYTALGTEHATSYFNYGALGFLIGHEIGHALGITTHRLDAKGESSNWLNKTEEEYLDRASCFEEQYSTMETETGVQLNGSKTINEDISDNLGVKAAYRAYRKLETNDSLPGLWNYTRRQLFWISMVQTRCGFVRQSYYQKFVDNFVQTLFPYDVFGMIENMPDFAKDFNCPPDSEMYSEKNTTCTLF